LGWNKCTGPMVQVIKTDINLEIKKFKIWSKTCLL